MVGKEKGHSIVKAANLGKKDTTKQATAQNSLLSPRDF